MLDAKNIKRVKKIIRNELGILDPEIKDLDIDTKSLRRMKKKYRY